MEEQKRLAMQTVINALMERFEKILENYYWRW